ncbi:MAG: copper homeostasis protein CutC [Saprospiraceae bacterium]|nr:MAG: copper homeostasis protein CutC [Saprospiraceae bacterium]
MTLEICCDSVASALIAEAHGADRIELCENLDHGGVTPSAGKIELAKEKINIPVLVLVRPRKGDFFHSDTEFELIKRDIRLAKQFGADGIVAGALLPNGQLDIDRTAQLIEQAAPLPFTFHRAFDHCHDPQKTLEQLIRLGVSRLLTSGQANSAIEGIALLETLLKIAGDQIEIIAGGGIRPRNIDDLIEALPDLNTFHSSARKLVHSGMNIRTQVAMGTESADLEGQWYEVDGQQVSDMRKILDDSRQ